MEAIGPDLRYLKAEQLRTDTDDLTSTVLLNPDNRKLGRLAGALIDPLRRRVRYLIIESRDWLRTHRYAIPLETTRFDRDRHALLVDIDANALQEIRVDTFKRFSDDDLIAALFSPAAA